MQATIYLRDGSRLVVLDAQTVKEEYLLEGVGFELKLVCRTASGDVVGEFDRDDVLAYRRQHSRHVSRDDLPTPVCVGTGVAAE